MPVIDDWSIFCEIALRWRLLDLTDDESTLVQGMTWWHEQQAVNLAKVSPYLCHHMASLGHNGLIYAIISSGMSSNNLLNYPTDWFSISTRSSMCNMYWHTLRMKVTAMDDTSKLFTSKTGAQCSVSLYLYTMRPKEICINFLGILKSISSVKIIDFQVEIVLLINQHWFE